MFLRVAARRTFTALFWAKSGGDGVVLEGGGEVFAAKRDAICTTP
jgi:hypothetical protein